MKGWAELFLIALNSEILIFWYSDNWQYNNKNQESLHMHKAKKGYYMDTLTSPQEKPWGSQNLPPHLHPLCIWRFLPSCLPPILFDLRITVSKINLNPCALFPFGHLCLNLLSQGGEGSFLPSRKRISGINTLMGGVYWAGVRFARKAASFFSLWKRSAPARRAGRWGKLREEAKPKLKYYLSRLHSDICAYVHEYIYA